MERARRALRAVLHLISPRLGSRHVRRYVREARQLVSRLLAADLSAGVVLVWWPHVFDDADSTASWVARGLVWTLISELLAMGFGPLEELLWTQTRVGRAVAGGAARLRARTFDGVPARRRVAVLSAVAATALVLPIGLIAQGRPVAPETPPTARVTKIVRPVTVRQVPTRVEQAPPVPGAAAVTAPARTVTTVVRGSAPGPSDDRRARGSAPARQQDRPSRPATRPQPTATTSTTEDVADPAAASAPQSGASAPSTSEGAAPTSASDAEDDRPAAPRAATVPALAS